ncbi:FliM/FliN family flagellar motor switch protein [Dyella nitratireducens]|nr:FliM/FliN family flagellar motor switch protein [Dyella nitratireducens]
MNRFAGAERIVLVENFAEEASRFAFHLEQPLDGYCMVCIYSCSYGDLQVGLDMGAMFPEYSSDVVMRVAKSDKAIGSWIDWLISPWIERLEQHLGVNLSLQDGQLNAPFPRNALAFLVTREDGNSGHLAVTGTVLGHIRWNDIALLEPRQARYPDWLRVMVVALYESRALPLQELRKLGRGAVLHAPWSGARLHVGPLSKGFRYHIKWKNEEAFMEDSKPASDRSAFATVEHHHDGEPVPLDDVAFIVDVVLDRRMLTLAELQALHEGGVFAVERPISGKDVTLCCHGHMFARGEIVSVDGQLAILISECGGPPV